ncbi:hypothetical protein DSO57_1013299 [Entomophthora muscae]|uniref:Uncharacterized protein n=1 Tax=Entomophthora muscae TaxID=34485 RepID=A0ACC2SUL6_9FUNG|nr:hypothetical protein DSO57_1013299 [Entomophthora muscae]
MLGSGSLCTFTCTPLVAPCAVAPAHLLFGILLASWLHAFWGHRRGLQSGSGPPTAPEGWLQGKLGVIQGWLRAFLLWGDGSGCLLVLLGRAPGRGSLKMVIEPGSAATGCRAKKIPKA